MPVFTQSDTRSLLQGSPDKKISSMSKETELVKSLTEVLNASLELAKEFPQSKTELLTGLAKKTVALSGLAGTASGSRAVEITNFAAGQTLKTIGLTALAGMSVPRAAAFITMTMADKVVATAGFAQLDKCKVAVASLAVSGGMAGISCIGPQLVLTGGIPCMVGTLAVAADAFYVYGQCSGK